jgi:hypothetical protein
MRNICLLSLGLIAVVASAQRIGGARGGGAVGGFRSGAGNLTPPITTGAPWVGSGRFSGSTGAPWFGSGRFSGSGFRYGRFGNFGNPYSSPYFGGYPLIYPFVGDYDLLWDYPLGYQTAPAFPPINNSIIVPEAQSAPTAPEPLKTANPVTKDYKWNEAEAPSGDQAATFTVALKDGSKRYAATAWVQDSKLHYLDAEGRQQVLSPDVIDRETTQSLNRQNHLDLQLPPG